MKLEDGELDKAWAAANIPPGATKLEYRPIPDGTWLKNNVILIVQKHRRQCDGDPSLCGVSLMALAVLCERAGLKLTDDELKEFA